MAAVVLNFEDRRRRPYWEAEAAHGQ